MPLPAGELGYKRLQGHRTGIQARANPHVSVVGEDQICQRALPPAVIANIELFSYQGKLQVQAMVFRDVKSNGLIQ